VIVRTSPVTAHVTLPSPSTIYQRDKHACKLVETDHADLPAVRSSSDDLTTRVPVFQATSARLVDHLVVNLTAAGLTRMIDTFTA
jgi:hypothetical protein